MCFNMSIFDLTSPLASPLTSPSTFTHTRRYLYDGAENSEAVTAEAFGKKHIAYPIRDHTGCAVAVVDLGMRKGCPIPAEEMREAMKVLKLLTMAHHQLSRGSVSSGVDSAATTALNNSKPSRKVSRVKDATVLFHQLMLSDLRERVEKLDTRWDILAHIQSYDHKHKHRNAQTHTYTHSSRDSPNRAP